ncbi:deoxyhypusine synthase family protein [Magnetococcales bacterium HHB-1]
MQPRQPRSTHAPENDGLKPVKALDLNNIHTINDLLTAYATTSFGARRVGQAADIFETIVRDPDCATVLTLSGAMTVAKMGLVICEMIERGYVDAIISTGALMAHGLVEGIGRDHYQCPSPIDDKKLYQQGYNRVYDTLEPENNLDEAEQIIRQLLSQKDFPSPFHSAQLTHHLGAYLAKHFPKQRSPLRSAFEHQVPLFIPALTDCEIGLNIAVFNERQAKEDRIQYDPFGDLEQYRQWCQNTKKRAIFTIGGGVPRNYAQQISPFMELRALRHEKKPLKTPLRFQYGIRICPDPAHLGGLSGCSYQEGISWGKFVPPQQGGAFAEIPADATIVWPLLVKTMMERVPYKIKKHRNQ